MFTTTWLPPFVKLLVDDSGVAWLQSSDDASWVVLDNSARIVGQIALPQRNLAIAVRGDDFWTMMFDVFDVPSLVRYRISRSLAK